MVEPAVEPGSAVEEIEHCWIPLPDGLRLAARLWLPARARHRPVPALFEYIPYRKGDMVRARDERNHPVFAAAGYAALRVDMRGSGDSDGLMADMYGPEELEDAHRVIDWIARQPWCDGRVGMFGTSWGGTAALQAAVDAPAALKAVIALCATHDRYEDDIHHKGGLLLTDSVEWGATLPAVLAAPPAAATVGEDWFETWEQRLLGAAFPLEAWVREEERSAYWQWGSVARQAGRLSCPVLAIGGWSDRYSNSVMSLVELNPEKVWGIVGPWGHHYPDLGHPGPAIHFQREALGWWDHWLGSEEPATPNWPRLRLWLSDFDPPREVIDRRRGRWIELARPASAATESEDFYLGEGALARRLAPRSSEARIPYDLRVGAAGGDSGYFGRYGGLPTDQASDDARSLVFETGPLEEPFSLVGSAVALLEILSDRPLAQVALRLCDVAPDGAVARVSLALRNLALDDSLETGRPLQPDRRRVLRIPFPTRAYRFAAGHRIRLALSSSYWPLAWPAPEPTRLALGLGGCRLTLPRLAGEPAPLLTLFAPPEPKPEGHRQVAKGPLTRSAGMEEGWVRSGWHQGWSAQFFPETDTLFGFETSGRHALQASDPQTAVSRFEHRMRIERPDGAAEIKSWAELRSDHRFFHLQGRLEAEWRGKRLFVRDWSPSLRRRIS